MDNLYNTDQGSAPFEFAELMSRVASLDSELRKMREQSGSGKKGKKGKSKKDKRTKKLKKRIKMLEMQQEQMKYFLQVVFMQQRNMPQHQTSGWLSEIGGVAKKVLPTILTTLAVDTIKNKNLPQQPQYVLPAHISPPPLYLPDYGGKK